VDWWRWAVLGMLGALVALGIWVLALARRTDRSLRVLRPLRQQLSNIISMLTRAGYKKGPTVDWNDDFKRTEVRMESDKTQWDWKAPRG
jgi:hypothetical protein